MRPANVRVCPSTPTHQRLHYQMSSNLRPALSVCGFLTSRRLLRTKTTCGNNLGKGPSPDLKRSSLVYGILTCIGSLGLLNSSQNRPNSSEMASAEKDMYQDHCQWMALRLRYIEEMECIGLLSREYAPLHACHTFI